jgi:hypothetical protein
MSYLDLERLNAIDPEVFRSQKPYPWINPEGLLTDEGYAALVERLPAPGLFQRVFGKARKFGQRSHDRFALEYREKLALPQPWNDFLGELRGPGYRRFLERMFGRGSFRVRFHWHFAPNGCSVSPHCDSWLKLGSHIFYLNRSSEWDPAWGGETLVLDDGGRFSHRATPDFEDFERIIPARCQDNMSFLFRRTSHSWHGVREVHCPEGEMRRVFIVVIDDMRLSRRVGGLLRGGRGDRY